jgi:hypothetical protein
MRCIYTLSSNILESLLSSLGITMAVNSDKFIRYMVLNDKYLGLHENHLYVVFWGKFAHKNENEFEPTLNSTLSCSFYLVDYESQVIWPQCLWFRMDIKGNTWGFHSTHNHSTYVLINVISLVCLVFNGQLKFEMCEVIIGFGSHKTLPSLDLID